MEHRLTEAQMEQYRREGYVILRGIIPLEDVEALRSDVRDLVECSARGEGPEIPWIRKEKRLPERLGWMLRPGWIRPAFVKSLQSGPYFPISEQILGTAVRYSLFGMLAGGDGKPYIQEWHRDLAPISGPHELEILQRNYRRYTQINAPLFSDRYLQIVPGSHLRCTTDAEREAHAKDPKGEMPGQMTVEMEPGDVVFYYSNLWHRGYNPEGVMRWTMHHAFVSAGTPVGNHEAGQQGWIGSPGYLESLPPKLRVYMQRFLDDIPEGPLPNWREL